MPLVYYRNVKTTAKGRWCGRTVREILPELSSHALFEGDTDHVINPKDIIEYKLHMHEPDVPDFEPKFLLEVNKDFIVINKPSGIPVHPTVNYYQNTVTEKLKPEFGTLYPCYRLDKLTSGVLVLARTTEFASKFNKFKKSKIYLARVRTRDLPINFTTLEATDPIVTYNTKRGYPQFLESISKPQNAHTKFELFKPVNNNNNDDGIDEYTVLKCTLFTGRTHQIRKHLALHGMPIHNDPVYQDHQLFTKLMNSPNETTFNLLSTLTEQKRLNKLSGGTCPECGSDLYNQHYESLDLHCYEYTFNGYTYHT